MTPAQIVALVLEGAVKAGLAIYQAAGQTEEQARAQLAADLIAYADAGDVDVAAVREAMARSRAALAELVQGT